MKKHINIVIVHYNTPKLTECLIKSINKYVGLNCTIYIFDNSDKFPFTYKQDNIKIFDNTNRQIIDFDVELSKYPSHLLSMEASGTYASFKHCVTIEKCISLIDKSFILMDSDILLKRDISSLFDNHYTFVGSTEFSMGGYRILPYLCFINVNYLKKHNKHYFNPDYMHGLHQCNTKEETYDTGRWFYETLLNTNYRLININNFIIHYKAGSWAKQNEMFYKTKRYPIDKWLLDNQNFYTTNYKVSNLPFTNKETPIYVSLTSWKERLHYLPEYFSNLQKQTMKPDKYILWLSSDEIKENEVPSVLYTYTDLEICWVDTNLKSFKKFLTIEQNPSAINIILDDDRLYHENTIKDLVNAYENSNKKTIIGFYTDICNSKGQPWGGVAGNDITSYKWINTSCVLFPPNLFPMEIFYYFTKIMTKNTLVSDESFIMPFLIYHKLSIQSIGGNLENLNKVSPIITSTINSALHTKFFVENGNVRTNKKNQLIWDICNELPVKYLKAYLMAFPNFGRDVVSTEKLIVTLTSWKKRIKNIPVVLTTILQQTKKPDKIVLNLSSDEFPGKMKDLSTDVLKFLKDNSDIIEINWIDGENKKQWKKMLPTLKLYPNDAIVCIDDDFLYPDDMLATLWDAHLKHPLNPISGNSFKLHGIQCQCGCASLTKLSFLDNVFEYATDEIQKMHSDDVFFTYVAAKAGNPYMYCGKEYFLNMKTYGEVDALSNNSSAFDSLNVMWNYLVKHYGEISLASNYENFSFSAKPIKRTITTQTTNTRPSRCKCRVVSYGIGSLKTYKQKTETFLIEHMMARDTNVKHNKVVRRRMA